MLLKKGIYCSLHVIDDEIEVYTGPILYEGAGSNFVLVITSNHGIVTLYSSNTDPFVPKPSPEAPFEDPFS